LDIPFTISVKAKTGDIHNALWGSSDTIRISDNLVLKKNGGRIRESFPAWQDFYILLGVAGSIAGLSSFAVIIISEIRKRLKDFSESKIIIEGKEFPLNSDELIEFLKGYLESKKEK